MAEPHNDCWMRVEDGMPDADLTVLIHIPDGDGHSEPVWVGYTDGELWFTAEGMPARVTHWRELPAPPEARLMDIAPGAAGLSDGEPPSPVARFARTSCSQCGGEFGPGDTGYSHCVQHRRRRP